MSRARKCRICTGDLAVTGRINAMIESGVKLKVIAEQVPEFSPYQLSRHKRNCLAPKPALDLTADAGSAEIQKWLQRAEDTYLVAQSNGDAKSAVSAISTAVRGLTQLAKQIEKELEQQKAAGKPGETPMTIENLDKLIDECAAQVENERGLCLYCGLPRNRKEQNELSAN